MEKSEKKRGRPPRGDNKKYQYNFRFDEDGRDLLETLSFEMEKTKTDVVLQALQLLNDLRQ